MSRRTWLRATAAAGLAAVGVRGAEADKRRLGIFLYGEAPIGDEQWVHDELKELAKLGWVEGERLVVHERRSARDAGLLALHATEFARSGVDAILTESTQTTQALQQATKTVPIVTGVGDPVGSGFARSLAQPGGNITGISLATGEIARKQVELLRIVVPRVSRLAIMIGRNPAAREVARPVQVAAQEAGLASELDVVTSIPDLDRTFARDPAGSRAVFILSVPVVTGGSKAVAELALRNRVPTISGASEYVEAGCLLSYTLLHENALQRWAAQLDKIFRGANPAQIPFELPTKTQFAINRATARALGLPVPAELLLRADQVVD